MSKRRKAPDPVPPAKPVIEPPDAPIDSWWVKIGSICGIVGLVPAFVMPFVAFYLLDPKYQELRHVPQLTVNQTEILATDSHVFDVVLANEGTDPAKNVTLVLESYRDGFTFPQTTHVHVLPPVAFTKEITNKKIEVRLAASIGGSQSVRVILDRIPLPGDKPLEYLLSASSDQGLARVGKRNVIPVDLDKMAETFPSEIGGGKSR